eukprot:TRINITY_DN12244_c0_g3_i1.p1 TRINITY_DN12244_c0_g3~~TRINITY_DN12244_c0_g3_i1.p1  ORF type:complete len:1343 (-),score=261.11 TRINITY_DN12244_c0_g3_i1:29-3550(-)
MVSAVAQTICEPEPEHIEVIGDEADEIAAALFGCVSRAPRNSCERQRDLSSRGVARARDNLSGGERSVGIRGPSVGSAESRVTSADQRGGVLDPGFMAAVLDAENEQAAVVRSKTPPPRRSMTPIPLTATTVGTSTGVTGTSFTSPSHGRVAASDFGGSGGGDGGAATVGVGSVTCSDCITGNLWGGVSSVGHGGDSFRSTVMRRTSNNSADAAASLLAATTESVTLVTANEPPCFKRKEEQVVRPGALFIRAAVCGANQPSLVQSSSERALPDPVETMIPVTDEAAVSVPVEAASIATIRQNDVFHGCHKSGEGDGSDASDYGSRGGCCSLCSDTRKAASSPTMAVCEQQEVSIPETKESPQPWDRFSPLTSKGSRRSDDADASSSKPDNIKDIACGSAVQGSSRSVIAPAGESSNACCRKRNSLGSGDGGNSSSSSSSSSSSRSSCCSSRKRSSIRPSPPSAASFFSGSDSDGGDGGLLTGSILWRENAGRGERTSPYIRSPSDDTSSALMSRSSEDSRGHHPTSPRRGPAVERGNLDCDKGHAKHRAGYEAKRLLVQPAALTVPPRTLDEMPSRERAVDLVRVESPAAKDASGSVSPLVIGATTPAVATFSQGPVSTMAPSATKLAEKFARGGGAFVSGGGTKSSNKMTLATRSPLEEREVAAAVRSACSAESPPSVASPAETLQKAASSWLEQGLSSGSASPHGTTVTPVAADISATGAYSAISVRVESAVAVTADPHNDAFARSAMESRDFDSLLPSLPKVQKKDDQEMDGPLLGAESVLGDTLRNMAVAVAHADAILWRVGDEHKPEDKGGRDCGGGGRGGGSDEAEDSRATEAWNVDSGENGGDGTGTTRGRFAARDKEYSRDSPLEAVAAEGAILCGGDSSVRARGDASAGYAGSNCHDSATSIYVDELARKGCGDDTARGRRSWQHPPIMPLTPPSLSYTPSLSFPNIVLQKSSQEASTPSSRPKPRQPSRPASPTGSARSAGSNDTSLFSMPQRGSVVPTMQRTRDAGRFAAATHIEQGIDDLSKFPPSPNPSVMSLTPTPGNATFIDHSRSRRSGNLASAAAAWAAPPRLEKAELTQPSSRRFSCASFGQLGSSRAGASFSSGSAVVTATAAKPVRRRQSLGEPQLARASHSEECALCGATGHCEPGTVFCQACSSRMDEVG